MHDLSAKRSCGMHDRSEWTSSTGRLVSSVNNDTIAGSGGWWGQKDRGKIRIFPRIFAYNPAGREFTAFENPWKVVCCPSSLFAFLPSTGDAVSVSWASSILTHDSPSSHPYFIHREKWLVGEFFQAQCEI